MNNWPSLIAHYRSSLKLSQAAFGQSFGFSGVSVHYWETGRSEAPYSVTWAALRWGLQHPDLLSSLVEGEVGA